MTERMAATIRMWPLSYPECRKMSSPSSHARLPLRYSPINVWTGSHVGERQEGNPFDRYETGWIMHHRSQPEEMDANS
jgi:hypothetical protein